jgi:arylsulfatase A-like enzyme
MNVIFVMSDSLRRDHIGVIGDKGIKTPALDKFAAEAVDFPNFRMGSYATIPQRTDMFTGRSSWAERPWQPLEPDDVVLAEILSEAGVSTYLAGDTPHIFRMGLTFMRGFDGYHWSRGSEGDIWWTDYYEEAAYTSPTGKGRVRFGEDRYKPLWAQGRRRVKELDWTTPQTFDAAIEWLTRNYRRENFFLYIDTFDPHEPWDPPRWVSDLYDPDYEGEPYAWAEYGSVKQYGEKELKRLQSLYAGECTMVDRWFGRLMETLDLLELRENTMVIFMSDHGHYLGHPEDGGQVGKHTGYRTSDGKMADADADVYMPLLDSVSNAVFLARLPGQSAPASRPEIAQPADIMPTILEYFGLTRPASVQSRSMLPLMRGEDPPASNPWRNAAVTAQHNHFAQITDKRWLYGTWAYDNPPRLFDRETDPAQSRDVLSAQPQIAKELHRQLVARMRELDAPSEWIAKIDEKSRHL